MVQNFVHNFSSWSYAFQILTVRKKHVFPEVSKPEKTVAERKTGSTDGWCKRGVIKTPPASTPSSNAATNCRKRNQECCVMVRS
jgi:hypothetical protein